MGLGQTRLVSAAFAHLSAAVLWGGREKPRADWSLMASAGSMEKTGDSVHMVSDLVHTAAAAC